MDNLSNKTKSSESMHDVETQRFCTGQIARIELQQWSLSLFTLFTAIPAANFAVRGFDLVSDTLFPMKLIEESEYLYATLLISSVFYLIAAQFYLILASHKYALISQVIDNFRFEKISLILAQVYIGWDDDVKSNESSVKSNHFFIYMFPAGISFTTGFIGSLSDDKPILFGLGLSVLAINALLLFRLGRFYNDTRPKVNKQQRASIKNARLNRVTTDDC